jgi:exopolysaccharide biosynthesis polyprenyl glycosylphosphotransferase
MRHAGTDPRSAVPVAAFAGGVAVLYEGNGSLILPIGGALLVETLFLRRAEGQIAHLRVMRALYPLFAPVLVVLALLAANLAFSMGAMSVRGCLLAAVAAAAVSVAVEALRGRAIVRRRTRVAFVGSAAAATRLARDLRHADVRRFELVGRIADDRDLSGALPVLGALGGLRTALVDARVDLLVVGGAVPRLKLFEEFADACLDLRVRMIELPELYEHAFGYLPVSEINAAWFARIVDGRSRPPVAWVKRALDLAMVGAVGVVALPVLALLAYLVHLDGGPALYAQTRIGERGRPFRLYKLRTMDLARDDLARWTADNDPRVTRLGAMLRRTHLDELPQLWNIARGEMSFVGPRPEQPSFVAHLECVLPFYQRRHVVRPGLTGWAQVRCGYAGSEVGSAWKLCNDLYYYEHRSLAVDLLVIAETAAQIILGCFGRAIAAVPSVASGLTAPLTSDVEPALVDLAPPIGDRSAPDHQPVGA